MPALTDPAPESRIDVRILGLLDVRVDGRSVEIATRPDRLALCREPTERELTTMQAFLEQETAATDRQRALVQLCRVILNLNEFVYPN